MKSIRVLSALLILALPLAAADVKYTMEMRVSGPQAQGMPPMRSTVYMKGTAERRDMDMMGMGTMSTITHCDTHQAITLNSRCNAYMTTSGDAVAPPMGARPARQGGTVTIENDVRDTGETKTILGHPARHVIMKMTADAPQGTCHPGHMEVTNDAWIITDLNVGTECRREQSFEPPQMGGCRDKYEMHFKGSGVAGMRGVPAIINMTMALPDGQKQSMTMEVKEISTETLDASLFQPPAGAKQANSPQEMFMCSGAGMGAGAGAGAGAGMPPGMDDPRVQEAMKKAQAARAEAEGKAQAAMEARRSGAILIGVAFNDRSHKLDASTLTRALVGKIQSQDGFDAVKIDAGSPADIQKEAATKKCDFVLYADVADAKTASPKIGGMLGRAAGVGGNIEPRQQIRMDYRLATVEPPDQQVAKETFNTNDQAPSMDQVAASLMEKTADRATSDARRAKRK